MDDRRSRGDAERVSVGLAFSSASMVHVSSLQPMRKTCRSALAGLFEEDMTDDEDDFGSESPIPTQAQINDADELDPVWYVTGDTVDGSLLKAFVVLDPLVLHKIEIPPPSPRERRVPEPTIVHEYTCGAVQAGAMVVRCDCGCVRQHDRPHDYVADVQLRGWICYCGIFNGEEKERMTKCRTCEAPRPL